MITKTICNSISYRTILCIDTHPPPMYGTSSPPMRLPRPHDPPPYALPIDMSKQS